MKNKYFFPVRDAVDNDKVTLVPVDKEFYMEANRAISSRRKYLQRHGECCCPRNLIWKCDGDCDRCRYHIQGDVLRLDEPISEDLTLLDTIADDSPLPEELVEDKELLDALFRELGRLDEQSRKMCEVMSTMSERDAAEEMNTPRNTLVYQWNKLKAKLRANLEVYR